MRGMYLMRLIAKICIQIHRHIIQLRISAVLNEYELLEEANSCIQNYPLVRITGNPVTVHYLQVTAQEQTTKFNKNRVH